MADNKFMKELLEISKGNAIKDVISSLKSQKSSLIKLNKELDKKISDFKVKENAIEQDVSEKVVENVATESEKVEEVNAAPEKVEEVKEAVKEESVAVKEEKPVEQVKEEKPASSEVKTETKTITTKVGVVLVKTESNGNSPARERRFLQRPVEEPKKREFRPANDRNTDRPKSFKPNGERPAKSCVAPKAGQGFKQSAPVAQAFVPKDAKNYSAKQKKNSSNGKNYEDKKAPNKRALAKEQLNNKGFDENESGYRKVRKQKKDVAQQTVTKIEHAVITKEEIPIKELSEKIGVSAVEITKMLFKEMIMKTINDSLSFDVAQYIASEAGVELELKLEKSAEERLSEEFDEQSDDQSGYVKRPPIVTVMGHVDHGKTSLLDKIRSANVTAGEAGGITQHIGAYTVEINGEKITFLDTPGHAAFTQMRARGAQITDIAILVVAADDGIMPQTVEAINHAKSANVPIIVAANKIDKQHSDLDRVRQQLADKELLVEDWGGDTMMIPVSAKTGEGIDKLLESVLMLAELKELKANPDRSAKGTIVEAKLDKGKGPVANVIVQNGTLRTGDDVVAGTVIGRVRAMTDDKGRMIKEAGPSMPVSIIGLDDVPNAGDTIYAVKGGDKDKLLKLVAQERKNKERLNLIKEQKMSYEDAINKMAEGDLKNLNIIIKADVQGSVEAVKDSLMKLSDNEVKVTVVHSGVGAINETDVTLADSSSSIIIGFNVRPDSKAKVLAERSKVSIKIYKIIYEAIEDVQNAMKGLVVPKYHDVYMGKSEVKETFKIKGVGVIAGCVVTEGKMVRKGKLMIYRDDVKICEGNVLTLKHYKDEVAEISAGQECGISIENFNEIKVGDFIECYIEEEDK